MRFDLAPRFALAGNEELGRRLAHIADRVGERTGVRVGIHAERDLVEAAMVAAHERPLTVGALALEGHTGSGPPTVPTLRLVGNDPDELAEAARWFARHLQRTERLDQDLLAMAARRPAVLRRAAAAAAVAAGAVGLTPAPAAASVTASYDSTTDIVTVAIVDDAGTEAVVVTCESDRVLVNGAEPSGSPNCSDVVGLIVNGSTGNDSVVLSEVQTSAGFTAVTGTTVHGNAGNDAILGTEFADTLTGGGGADTIQGFSDNDALTGGAGQDTLEESRDASFTLTGTSLSDGLDVDSISGFERASLTGGAGGNAINTSAFSGDVTLSGGPGNDTLTAGPGTSDRLAELGDVSFTLTNTSLNGLGTDSLSGLEAASLTGGPSANSISASAFSGPSTLAGSGGDDTLLGGGSTDVLSGGLGADSVAGAGGNDSYMFGSSDEFDGDTLADSSGADTLDLSALPAGDDVFVDLDDSDFQGDPDRPMISSQDGTKAATGGRSDFEHATTGAGHDTLRGSSYPNSLVGGAGDDDVSGGGGVTDTLAGGSGLDVVVDGTASAMTVTDTTISIGGTVTDEISGFEHATLRAQGFDPLAPVSIDASAFSGTSSLQGLHGNDTLLGSVGGAFALGHGGDDSLKGGSGADWLVGNDGNDSLEGGAQSDRLWGLADNDRYIFSPAMGTGDDEMVDDPGNGSADTLDFSAFMSGGFDVELASFTLASDPGTGWQLTGDRAGGADPPEVENVIGGGGNDTLSGSGAANSLIGGAGADILDGREGNDTTVGGTGNDLHTFEDDGDGVAETDLIRELSSGGTDEASFAGVTTPVTADLRPGTPNNLARYTNRTVNLDPGATGAAAKPTVENLTGGSASDSLTGSQGINVISGGAGDDTFGATFKDTVQGGEGTADRAEVKGFDASEVYNPDAAGLSGVELLNVFMTGGNDRINIFSITGLVGVTLEGGTGNDTITGSVSADTLNGQAGNDVVDGRAGDDRINGVDGTDDLVGGDGNDTIFGGLLNDLLVGGNGHDSLLGEDGDDTLNGGNDNDTLNGGPGNDSLNGGAGTNVLIP